MSETARCHPIRRAACDKSMACRYSEPGRNIAVKKKIVLFSF